MISLSEINREQEKEAYRRSDLQSYLAGIDLMFGVGPTTMRDLPDMDRQKIIENAEKASKRQFGDLPGEEVYLSQNIAKEIVSRLGIEKTIQDIQHYKGEIEERLQVKNPTIKPEVEEVRNRIKEELFVTKRLKRIVFS